MTTEKKNRLRSGNKERVKESRLDAQRKNGKSILVIKRDPGKPETEHGAQCFDIEAGAI